MHTTATILFTRFSSTSYKNSKETYSSGAVLSYGTITQTTSRRLCSTTLYRNVQAMSVRFWKQVEAPSGPILN